MFLFCPFVCFVTWKLFLNVNIKIVRGLYHTIRGTVRKILLWRFLKIRKKNLESMKCNTVNYDGLGFTWNSCLFSFNIVALKKCLFTYFERERPHT